MTDVRRKMSHDLDDTIISAWASHMLWLHHGLQSALSYPFSVISSPLSSLPPSLPLFSAQTASHTVLWFHPLPLSACPPTGSPSSDYCLFIQKQNPWLEGCTILAENEETQIYRVFLSLSLLALSLSYSHTGTRTHTDAIGSNGYHNSALNHQHTDTTIPASPQSGIILFSVSPNPIKNQNQLTRNGFIIRNSNLHVHWSSSVEIKTHKGSVTLHSPLVMPLVLSLAKFVFLKSNRLNFAYSAFKFSSLLLKKNNTKMAV